MKTKQTKYYHVFTNGKDNYFNVNSYGEEKALRLAKAQAKEWEDEGCGNIRIYEKMEEDEELISEDCIYSVGSFPH